MQRMDSILPLSNMCVCEFVQASMCDEGSGLVCVQQLMFLRGSMESIRWLHT